MLEYQGQPCIKCGERFTESDDIVVCPECGTPYHRACYQEAGACINQSLHESGSSWQAARKAELAAEKSAEKLAEQAAQAEERARGEVPQMINASLYDGVRLNPDAPCVGLDPNEQFDGASMGEVAEFVATNKFYYLPLFRLMKKTGKKFSFNLACLFFPHLYFANRKMWAMTIGTIFLNMILNIPANLVFLEEWAGIEVPWVDITTVDFQRIYSIFNFGSLVFSVLCCLFANYLYYRFTVRQIGKIRKASASEAEMHQTLKTAGGTSAMNIVLALVIQCAVASTAVLMLLLIR